MQAARNSSQCPSPATSAQTCPPPAPCSGSEAQVPLGLADFQVPSFIQASFQC